LPNVFARAGEIMRHDGRLRHSKLALRGPVLEGDVAYLNGEVVSVEALSPLLGVPLATIKIQITNQDGALLVDGVTDVEVQFWSGSRPRCTGSAALGRC